MSEIQPIHCPHCGPGESIVEAYQDDLGYWKVSCGACGSSSGVRPKSDLNGREKVVTHWNKRTPSLGYDEMIEALTEIASLTHTENLLWWQIEARAALRKAGVEV